MGFDCAFAICGYVLSLLSDGFPVGHVLHLEDFASDPTYHGCVAASDDCASVRMC